NLISRDDVEKSNQFLLLNAEMYALRDLASSCSGLHRPSIQKIDLVTQQQSAFWDSGAFWRTAKLARSTLRVISEAESSPELAFGAGSAVHALQEAELASSCLEQGLYEGALLHIYRGISVYRDRLTGEPYESINIVEHTIARLSSAQHVSLGAVIPLAY